MSKLRIFILIAVTAISSFAISESVRRAVAQTPPQSTVCEDELADYQDEIKECLDKASTMGQARACADI